MVKRNSSHGIASPVLILLLATLLAGAKWYTEGRQLQEGFFQSFEAGYQGYIVEVWSKDTAIPFIKQNMSEVRKLSDGSVIWNKSNTTDPAINNTEQYILIFNQSMPLIGATNIKLTEAILLMEANRAPVATGYKIYAIVLKDITTQKIYDTDYKEIQYGKSYEYKYTFTGLKIMVSDPSSSQFTNLSRYISVRDKNFKTVWVQNDPPIKFVKDEVYYLFLMAPDGNYPQFTTPNQLIGVKLFFSSRFQSEASLIDVIFKDTSGNVIGSNLSPIIETSVPATSTTTATEAKKDEGLGTGAIVGISIGAVLVLMLVGKFLFS